MIKIHKYASYTGLLCTLVLLGTMIYDMSRPGLFSLGVFNEIKIILCLTALPFCFFIFSLPWNKKTDDGNIPDSHWLLFAMGIVTLFGAIVGIIDTVNNSFITKPQNWIDSIFSSKPAQPDTRAYINLIIFSLGGAATLIMLLAMLMLKRKREDHTS